MVLPQNSESHVNPIVSVHLILFQAAKTSHLQHRIALKEMIQLSLEPYRAKNLSHIEIQLLLG